LSGYLSLIRLTTKAFYAGETLHANTTSINVAHLRKSSFKSLSSVIINNEAPATRRAYFLSGSSDLILFIKESFSNNSFPSESLVEDSTICYSIL